MMRGVAGSLNNFSRPLTRSSSRRAVRRSEELELCRPLSIAERIRSTSAGHASPPASPAGGGMQNESVSDIAQPPDDPSAGTARTEPKPSYDSFRGGGKSADG